MVSGHRVTESRQSLVRSADFNLTRSNKTLHCCTALVLSSQGDGNTPLDGEIFLLDYLLGWKQSSWAKCNQFHCYMSNLRPEIQLKRERDSGKRRLWFFNDISSYPQIYSLFFAKREEPKVVHFQKSSGVGNHDSLSFLKGSPLQPFKWPGLVSYRVMMAVLHSTVLCVIMAVHVTVDCNPNTWDSAPALTIILFLCVGHEWVCQGGNWQ